LGQKGIKRKRLVFEEGCREGSMNPGGGVTRFRNRGIHASKRKGIKSGRGKQARPEGSRREGRNVFGLGREGDMLRIQRRGKDLARSHYCPRSQNFSGELVRGKSTRGKSPVVSGRPGFRRRAPAT